MAYIQDWGMRVQAQPQINTTRRAFLHLSQNENGRMLNIKITDVNIPSGSTAVLAGTKPDGTVYSQAGTLAGNTATFAEDVQMTAVAGTWDAKITVTNGGNCICTARITITIDPDTVAGGAVPSDSQLDGIIAECRAIADSVRKEAYGSPLVADAVEDMTDQSRVYVYTGSESGMTAGHWYYYNGSTWADGGVYNAVAVDTDTTLSIAGKAADAKEVGDQLTSVKEDLTDLEETTIPEAADLFVPFSNITKFVQGDIDNDGVVSSSVKYRACTNGIIDLQGSKMITIKDGYRIYVRLYNTDGTYRSNTGWVTGNVTLSGKVAITIGKVPESTSVIYPPEELEKGLICKSDTGKTLLDIDLSGSYGFEETENILRFSRRTKVINGVTVDVYPYDRMVLNGVCTSGGGRMFPLNEMTLEAGSYYLTVTTEEGVEPAQLCVTKAVGNQTIKYGTGSFTLTETTSVYFSINIVGGVSYVQTLKVSLVKGGSEAHYVPPISAVDYKAREQLTEITGTKSAKYNRDNPLRIVSKNGNTWSQGACCVGDKMVGFSAGADDHSTNGTVKISNVFDLTNVTTVNHNLGHACSADYNSLTDTMMIGNGSTDHDTLPMMYLVKNVTNWIASPTNLLYNGANVMTIDLSSIGGAVMVCCFGENETIAYVMTIDSGVITIFRCLLGLGANDLTTIYPNDSYGTFVSGCGDTEYNGTLHVLSSYSGGTDVTGEIQGIKYHNGRIIMPTDKWISGITLLAFISVLTLDDATGKIIIDKNLWIPIVGADGSPIKTECEDVFFYKGCGYVMTVSTIGTTHYYRTSEFSLALY